MCVADVHTFKKKLTSQSTESFEVTYDYLLSLFVSKFHYSVTEFDLLTPSQSYSILHQKREIEDNQIELLKSEFRLMNYFTIKSAMGETSHIKSPSDLYHLDIDDEIKAYHQKKLENYQPDIQFIQWANKVLANT